MSPFDTIIDRRGSGCSKWSRFEPDVLPMWVADMDFAVADPILHALRERLAHPVLGYGVSQAGLKARIVGWLEAQYGWRVTPDDILMLPGVVPGFNMALRTVCAPGAGVVVQTPVYPPMLKAPENGALRRIDAPLTATDEVDRDVFGAALRQAGQGAFLLCNPHNPTGRAFGREELAEMAQACLSAGVSIVSDEIHCDLLFDGRRHIPIATLAPEVAARTITLMSAGKTWNIAGLNACWAVVTDAGLRARFAATLSGVADHVNILGLIATEAALAEGGAWRDAALAYLQANRDWLAGAVAERLPGVAMRLPEATYLAWLDCRGSAAAADPHRFFLEKARVGMNSGTDFGPPGAGFVRLNFGCPRAMLEDGIGRMARALAGA
ncbi:aminotransferase [Falsiroseomonas bella]|uniref:cysteine-S-conjugate beta-lyase n=1 Tax=Falsiroseomonas bella TaxID=2184016 RepID=A0A317F6N4_9PROT|nr:PatB family C-S lyase [Falsiroseomonas bella]PWS34871.1 aminotransferase [Falsiroseomonas bella]